MRVPSYAGAFLRGDAVRERSCGAGGTPALPGTAPLDPALSLSPFDFAKTGLQVVRCPSEHTEYDVRSLDSVPARVAAFRDLLHEAIGWQVYKRTGWL
jgi:hypothetical protein